MAQSPPVVESPAAPPPLGARARKRAETRERLFEAALREFREYGVAGAQIDRIARSVGVVRGTFYFHFQSKDDVLLELARRVTARIVRRAAALDDGHWDVRTFLHRLTDAITDEHSRVGEAGLAGELSALYMRRPTDLSLPPDQNAPGLSGLIAGRFSDLRAQGGIRNAIPDDLAASVFITGLYGIYLRIPSGQRLRDACDAFVDLFAAGLMSESADPPPGGNR